MEVQNPTPVEAASEENASPRRSHVAPALVSLDRVDDDPTFQLRPEGDLSLLATDLARLGQLFPVELRLRPPDRFQVICGFRRVAALRFLQRDKVLARLHTDLSDDDALLLALAAAVHGAPVSKEELAELKSRLEIEGRLSASARDMLEKALTPPGEELAPENVEELASDRAGRSSGLSEELAADSVEGVETADSTEEVEASGEEEVDADELASDVTRRLGVINQDLSLLADVFSSLEDERKSELLEQLRYSAELVTFLEEK